MGQHYKQIGLEERCAIASLQAQGRSIRQIAAALDRAPSSITRELRRNASRQSGYRPAYAHQQYRARRWTGSKLDRDPTLRQTVLDRLGRGHSPEQVAGRLGRERGAPVISQETIYRFVYAQIARTKDYRWRLLLPRAKSKRGWRGRKGGSPALHIAQRVPIHQRPAAADDRRTPGHWEADLMLFKTYGHLLLILHERSSRLLIAVRPPSKAADPIAHIIDALLTPLPPEWRQTITFDNETAFAYHYRLHRAGIQTFFCDAYAPWQKGGVENGIGRLRRYLPRSTDLDHIATAQLSAIISRANNTPRKCLDFQTPAEVFCSQLLHFECEFSFPLPRE